jgi:hypothetical protein
MSAPYRRPHLDCEDCWYSCAILTCDDNRKSDVCDCGADATNAALASLEAERDRYRDEAERQTSPRILELVAERDRLIQAAKIGYDFYVGSIAARYDVDLRAVNTLSFDDWIAALTKKEEYEPDEICPSCFQPWGTLDHVIYWEQHRPDMPPVLCCKNNPEGK